MSFRQRYGPWAIVAGASEGTGRAFARAIAAEGVACLLVANSGPLDQTAEEIRRDFGVDCRTAHIDLARPEAFGEIVAAASGLEVGLYVANAGADPYGVGFHDRPVADWLDLIRINVTTTVEACHHFGGLMRERRRGGLLLVNSGACYGGGGQLAIYTAAKAFQLNLSESLWSELRPYGVAVLTLVLGKTDTPAYHRLQARKGAPSSSDLAPAEAVAALGLARLAHGPVCNWGLDDADAGQLLASAKTRRERVLAIDAAIAAGFAAGPPRAARSDRIPTDLASRPASTGGA